VRDHQLPTLVIKLYQRQYSGDRYPRVEQQYALQKQNDRYRPHDPEVRRQ
jgi:hypothetical protein